MKSNAADLIGASPTKRRGLLLGAGAAGAAVLAAKSLPTAPTDVAAPAKPAAEDKAGYQLTQHVLRYYETTKV
jgi:hypothetical protein